MTQEERVSCEVKEYYSRRIRLSIRQFPGMPVFVVKLLTELQRDQCDIGVLCAHIKVDPGITTNLLRLANSARFGAVRRIVSVKEAVVRLGMERTLEILIAFHVAGHLSRPLKGYHLETSEMFMHSLWTATAAEEISKRMHAGNPAYVFTAALLHDLGKVLLSNYLLREQDVVLGLVQAGECSFDQAEKRVLGWSHGDVGAAILDNWNFPEILIQAARFHHAPENAAEAYRVMDSIINLADYLSYQQGVGVGVDGMKYLLSERGRQMVTVTDEDLEEIIAHTQKHVAELQQSFGM